MPFIVNWTGYRRYASPEQAKLNLAAHYRTMNKVRNTEEIDMFVAQGYEYLYNIQQGDIWGGFVLDKIMPYNDGQRHTDHSKGFSTLEAKKYNGKSNFLQSFYKGSSVDTFKQ